MKKFSSSYGGTKENFVIKIFPQKSSKIDEKVQAVFCVVRNILQRGTPTKPSQFLTDKLGDVDLKPTYLIDNSRIVWRNIKGDDENNYFPARKFYFEFLPDFLGEYAFVKNLILPEAEFSDLPEKNRAFDGQQVDFYLPQLKIAVEIDGASHDTPEQRRKDFLRDGALSAEKIEVIRITTKEFEQKTENFFKKMDRLKDKISQSKIIAEYKNALRVLPDDIRVKFDAVMRLQMALLMWLENNFAEKCLKIKIVDSDVERLEELLAWAYEDLSVWIKNIAQLAKVEINLPELEIVENFDSEAIALDFCMFRRYADGDEYFNSQAKKIYIRTDYFCEKDYYKISATKPVEYKFIAENDDDASLNFLVKNLFGHDGFREGQIPIIKNILSRRDTIGILPTGTGKSLCYQLPALLQPCVNIVVVPIISLMQDQEKGLNKNGINRVAYMSSANVAEREKMLNDFGAGKYQFMIVSPERLQNRTFREKLRAINENFKFATAVIDEVHCLSEWGHDFRTSYLRLVPTIRNFCTGVCLLGLTATASQAVLDDLKAEFENDGSGIKALPSMDREELVFERIFVPNDIERNKKIVEIIEKNRGTYEADGKIKNRVGLIFCQTVKTGNGCEKLRERLLKKFPDEDKLKIFHGQLDFDIKRDTQNEFMEENFSGLMVCTTAFGMGIDKPNIKYTIHNSLPKSIESFYQEAGRAGRDKVKTPKSHCCIIYKPETNKNLISKIFDKNTDIAERKKLCEGLDSDLKTPMFFFNRTKDPPEVECDKILAVLQELKNAEKNIDGQKLIDFDNVGITLEERLKVLGNMKKFGAVQYWKVFHAADGFGKIKVFGVDSKIIKKIVSPKIGKLKENNNGSAVTLMFNNNFPEVDFSLTAREMPLYKLTILGIVHDWTISYYNFNEGTLSVEYTEINSDNPENVKNSLLKYIRKHDAEFSLDGKISVYKKYCDLLEKYSSEPVRAYLMILITWTNDNIMYNRLQSGKNMLDFCSSDVSDEDFRRKINDFFKYTEQTIILDFIAQNPKNYRAWFEVITFKDSDENLKLINRDKAESTLTSLRRYLESYSNNTGLNFLSGMLRLICQNFDVVDGEGRLVVALQNVKEILSDAERKDFFERTFHTVKNLDDEEKNIFSETFLKIFPELAELVQQNLRDVCSLSFLIGKHTARINKILEANTNGLFKTA